MPINLKQKTGQFYTQILYFIIIIIIIIIINFFPI